MTDFDAQFNQILSNPDAMAQIARLARSLSGTENPPPDSPPQNQAQSQAPPRNQTQSATQVPPPQSPPTPAQSQAAPSDSNAPLGLQSQPAPQVTQPNPQAQNQTQPPQIPVTPRNQTQPPQIPVTPRNQTQNPADFPDLNILQKFLPIIKDLNGQHDSDARRLLYALRPYLPPKRQENIERALRLARLWRLGKRFLSEWEGETHV